jgi:TolB protein
LTIAVLALFVLVPSASTRPGRSAPALLTFALNSGPPGWNAQGLCLTRPDGSGRVRLTGGKQADTSAAWSRDGKRVAFSRTFGSRSKILIADARGRVLWNPPPADVHNGSPAWSPDGRQIAYLSSYLNESSILVDDSRTGERQSSIGGPTWSYYYAPSWSPDGSRLAFGHHAPNGGWDVYTARPDGTDRQLVARDASFPAWSPDGTKLAYVRFGSGVFPLVVANADGTNEHVVVASLHQDFLDAPAWSPDGTRLAFVRANGRPSTASWIVVVRVDSGKQLGTIKKRNSFIGSPAWRAPVPLPKSGRGSCG